MTFVSRRSIVRPLGVLAALLVAGMLGGCVTDQTTAAAPTVIPPGQATVIIRRADSFQGSLITADVDANGVRFASIANGATFTGGINPGPVILSVSKWSTPGQYVVRFNAVAGKRYAFEISPRSELAIAGIAAGMVGVVADTVINGENTSGPFKIVQVPNG
jgi:hypothetical protein